MKLFNEQDRLTQMHPALDIVNDIVYVTARVMDEKGRSVDAVITSEKAIFDADDWANEKRKRGLETFADVELQCGSRWSTKSIQRFLDGTLTAPSWQQTYEEIYDALGNVLVMTDNRYLTVITLYAMMTYFQPLFDFLPILHFRGPAASGKSRAGAALSKIAFNGKMDGSPTPSTIFRRAHEGRYTQIIAETDHLAQLGSGDAFARQLQSGCSKTEATVEVSEGRAHKSFAPTSYRIFNPRVLLSTQRFKSHPLRSRCIRLDLVKSSNADERKLRRSLENEEVWSPLRDSLYNLLLLQWRDVESTMYNLKDNWHELSGRTFDKWLPLATMAKLVSDDALSVVNELAVESIEEQQEDAEGGFDAHIMKFAAWVTRYSDESLTPKQLYGVFLEPRKTSRSEQSEQPEWAEDTQDTVTISYLKQNVSSERKLVNDMKRLHLIPQAPKHTRTGNEYELNQEKIMSIVRPYMGDAFLENAAY
ncbi:hypothetical protein KDA_18250 [Dictyobacter alpinus]|uniref:DUF3631 domain-containing protein n=1 Tax=Dictyobacter alpinus TaxID=2014873 RepID=A0A402B4S4_9CHLR|nr:hypothetical protein [Dictyobacter alpinus]GCE26341.1 hypothetical protein KDA_18250 [Dictyobacter alpinus]